jgi:hypothetical protein
VGGLAFCRALDCEEVGEVVDGPRRYALLERAL